MRHARAGVTSLISLGPGLRLRRDTGAGHGPRAPHRPEEGGAGVPLLRGEQHRGEGARPPAGPPPARPALPRQSYLGRLAHLRVWVLAVERGLLSLHPGRAWMGLRAGAVWLARKMLTLHQEAQQGSQYSLQWPLCGPVCVSERSKCDPALDLRARGGTTRPTRRGARARLQVIEKAYKKLRLDALVIQQGRLTENTKTVNKDDLLSMVRYGAEMVFSSSVRARAGAALSGQLSAVFRACCPPCARAGGAFALVIWLRQRAVREVVQLMQASRSVVASCTEAGDASGAVKDALCLALSATVFSCCLKMVQLAAIELVRARRARAAAPPRAEQRAARRRPTSRTRTSTPSSRRASARPRS